MKNKKEIWHKDIVALGFKRIESYDPVYLNQYGFPYVFYQYKISDTHIIEWDQNQLCCKEFTGTIESSVTHLKSKITDLESLKKIIQDSEINSKVNRENTLIEIYEIGLPEFASKTKQGISCPVRYVDITDMLINYILEVKEYYQNKLKESLNYTLFIPPGFEVDQEKAPKHFFAKVVITEDANPIYTDSSGNKYAVHLDVKIPVKEIEQ